MIDFTAYRHPVLAVPCPICRAAAGVWCRRPSGHRAADFHRDRMSHADTAFIARHGVTASIKRTAHGWIIDPRGLERD